MRHLSKSKLLSWRQCPRKLWLEVHQPELAQVAEAVKARFAAGHRLGEIARAIYDPQGRGTLLELKDLGMTELLAQTQRLLPKHSPIFEAGFAIPGALALADVLLPVGRGRKSRWRMVEVKSASSVKPYHRDDAAIQFHVASQAGIALDSIAVATINKEFVYPGRDTYEGLLNEEDLTAEVVERQDEVASWITDAGKVANKRTLPACTTGKHCADPVPCGFLAHCQSLEPKVAHPVTWLPRIQSKALIEHLTDASVRSLRQVPDTLLNEKQLRVKQCTLKKQAYFDKDAARSAVEEWGRPLYFLDFETISHAVPVWKGLKPNVQVPFQFSVHRLDRKGQLSQQAFLDLTGKDPSKACAEALIQHCGKQGAIVSYNAKFEKTCIRDLAQRFPSLKEALLSLNDRIVDLLPIMQEHYYHPSMQGSWSIKAVLPALVPELRYAELDGVQDGGGAQAAYLDATNPETSPERKEQLRQQLLAYCGLDTLAMVKLWQKIVED